MIGLARKKEMRVKKGIRIEIEIEKNIVIEIMTNIERIKSKEGIKMLEIDSKMKNEMSKNKKEGEKKNIE